tara:strand:- start:2674 stop:4101 length:1428 start_codon:yes stop_codon:yes gene_type:complete
MALNPFFLQGSPDEQRLMQSLIDEHLSMFGVDVYYIPRKMIDTDDVLGEVQSSKFNDAYIIEAYLNNFEGYAKGSDIMTKFGINLQNEITLTISRERYEDFIAPFIVTHNAKNAGTDVLLGERPKEGDLIFFPLGERLFEIKHVEHENPFYQLGKNYIYELQCELFRYEDEQFDTNVSFVDERALEEGEVTTVALAGIGSTALALVDSFASQGALQQIFLNDDGYGYTSAPSVVIGQSPAGVTSSRATAFAFTTERSGLYSVDQLVLQNPGFAYTEPPPFSFGGPGVGAAATSSLTNSGITSIRITDTGTNYFQPPTITIQHPSAVAIGTTGTVGSKPGQVQATAVATLDGNGISRIFLTNAGSGYEDVPLITIGDPLSLGVGTYFFNERVIGSQSGTEAFVKEWNEVERKLKLSINNGVFFPGEFITGTASSARYQILSHTGIDTTSPFTLNDEFEIAADNILDFTEKNPFGNF